LQMLVSVPLAKLTEKVGTVEVGTLMPFSTKKTGLTIRRSIYGFPSSRMHLTTSDCVTKSKL
jgi:hypothetical protein